ncbi:MAG: EamA family transporter [bacterium]
MLWLLIASIIWAFSFGLIGKTLEGVPGSFLACTRLALAMCVFLPFLRRVPARDMRALLLIGAVQFGLMYICYNDSFVYLQPHEVALFTVFTPVYVTLLHDLRQRRISWNALFAALLATAGAGVVLWHRDNLLAPWRGFLLVQASNLCFALGQLAYREWARGPARPDDRAVMGWLYLGGTLATLPWALLAVPRGSVSLSTGQVAAVIYLGLIASGLGFFLWNAGARRTPAGVLAVFNNLKIPLAAGVSLLMFGGRGDLFHLAGGGLLFVAATWLSQRKSGSAA